MTTAATSLHTNRSPVLGANDQVVVGLIGCGGRGTRLGERFASQESCRVEYVCDPDSQRVNRAKEVSGAKYAVADLRYVLEDPQVDAVVISTCDHWHAPAAILACQAGKHVYVEKPCAHNIREGRLMVEAARRYNRVMQHGTQTRSSTRVRGAIQMLQEGVIGDVLVAKHVNSQKRRNIGREKPSKPPSHLDYDLWVGPAEWRDFQVNYVHYNWHWFYNFGTGDIGNDGVHGIDIARWGLGVETHPSLVTGYGSKLFFDDDQEFPDTYTITYVYPGDGRVGSKRLLVYEQRIWSPYHHDDQGNSLYFYGTKGLMTLGGKGIRIYAEKNELIRHEDYRVRKESFKFEMAHLVDFLDAVRSGGRPSADIEVGHLSSTLSHLGNLVARTGRSLSFDPTLEMIRGDKDTSHLLTRRYREDHWAVPV